ncbi:sigma-70 family RNA polymerase sigma factor [Proteiniborus ethanoligenes]|nr:sigma-70 family RNA polymerase sigma factor [Proteiniborus ethanoligenes]
MRNKNLEKVLSEQILNYKEKYYRLAYSYVKNTDDALDIVQESIYKAITSLDKIQNPEYIKTWFYRIVINTSLDFLRKQKKIVIADAETLEFYSPGANDNYKDLDLQKALDNLPPNYRSIIVLRYFEDLKIEEIADILELNVNTVKTRLYSALKKLRLNMEE